MREKRVARHAEWPFSVRGRLVSRLLFGVGLPCGSEGKAAPCIDEACDLGNDLPLPPGLLLGAVRHRRHLLRRRPLPRRHYATSHETVAMPSLPKTSVTRAPIRY